MEAGFGLEPLAGESGVDGGACGGSDAAERVRGVKKQSSGLFSPERPSTLARAGW